MIAENVQAHPTIKIFFLPTTHHTRLQKDRQKNFSKIRLISETTSFFLHL